ncbi:MAG: GPW/gp25 family protein [Propionivibrio sp.]|nr:GPW/gp25 family protein [Propionivibrio sp.]MBK9029268.1 GPW/gp25 family protein [Propionivibrio sp.]
MADNAELYDNFLGTGWSFPPRFAGGGVVMSRDEQDIQESLKILFGTVPGERFLEPKFGLDMHALMFEPMSTTLRSLMLDRVRTAILIYEPRIKLINLQIDSPDPNEGSLRVLLEYEVRSTNSRFNLVFPFYRTDANEVLGSVSGAA